METLIQSRVMYICETMYWALMVVIVYDGD